MMLASSAIASASAAFQYICASPSRNACMKRVAASRYRYDPYVARVLPRMSPLSEIVVSPSAFPTAKPSTPIETSSRVPSPLPTAAAAATAAVVMTAPLAVRYVVVQFKHDSMTFLAPFRVSVGDLVVVEGDRGENIGIVSVISKEAPTSFAVDRKILRRATEADTQALALQRDREAAAVRTTQAMAESLGLQGRVEDAEYQFDLNKLTIFVRRASKTGFVDFRKLQRGLFREFRCRIWCAYMDEVEAAEAGPRTK